MIHKIDRTSLTKLIYTKIMFSIDHDLYFLYIKDSSDMVKHVVYPLEAVEKDNKND
jgi:hypothetical protein